MSVLLNGCTTSTLTECIKKKTNWNCIRMLPAILNKSWKQQPMKQQLYGHLSPIPKTIRIRRTIFAGHCRRNNDKLIRDVRLWTPTYGWTCQYRPTSNSLLTYICADAVCSLEDLPGAMDGRDEWGETERERERVR